MSSEQTVAQIIASKGLKLSDVARALGVNKSALTRWKQRRVPAERVLDVERVTDIPRHVLRPDLYPPPPSQEVA
jgi:DNA-binding transcriptional regulator YdaS (Cro superfamily)